MRKKHSIFYIFNFFLVFAIDCKLQNLLYIFSFETENGIAAQAQGVPRVFAGNPPVAPDVAEGSFSWTSPEGEVIAISYVADENGYQPSVSLNFNLF